MQQRNYLTGNMDKSGYRGREISMAMAKKSGSRMAAAIKEVLGIDLPSIHISYANNVAMVYQLGVSLNRRIQWVPVFSYGNGDLSQDFQKDLPVLPKRQLLVREEKAIESAKAMR